MADDDDEDGDNMFFDLHGTTMAGGGAAASDESRTMIRPVENAADWAQEVERVVPSLKVVIRHDAKDWRAHVEQMQVGCSCSQFISFITVRLTTNQSAIHLSWPRPNLVVLPPTSRRVWTRLAPVKSTSTVNYLGCYRHSGIHK